jgi:co-chaperonin GroES (HSP10)
MKPYGNRVLLKKKEKNEIEGISIPSIGTSLDNEPAIGEVVAVPDHRKDIKVGDSVIFAPQQSVRLYVDGEELFIASYDVIFVII